MELFLQRWSIMSIVSLLLIGPLGLLILFYTVLFTDYYYIGLLYFAYMIYDRKMAERGGRRIDRVHNWSFWEYAVKYFPITVIKTVELDPGKNYICGYHPHGSYGLGAMLKFAFGWRETKKLFPGMRCNLLAASQLLYLPVEGEIGLAVGCRTASKESITWALTKEGKGKMLILAIGGAIEALDAHPGSAKLTLKSRKGFVRLAIKHGASLVPMFAFGENETVSQYSPKRGTITRWIQDRFRQISGLTLPIPRSLIPLRTPIEIVMGKPIDVYSNPNPTQTEVDSLHKLYVDSLVSLFDRHKVNYGNYKNVTMEIV